MRSFVVGLVMAASIAACDNPTGAGITERATFSRHQRQWEQRGLHSYTFDYTEQRLALTYRVRLTVLDDTVASAVDLGSDLPDGPHEAWPTIDELFAIAGTALGDAGESVTIQYDSQYGFPTLFSAFSVPANPGGGFSATASNLQPLQ